MHGLYFVYISVQEGRLDMHGPYDKRRGAEGLLFEDIAALSGWPLHGDEERQEALNDAYSKSGLEMSANKTGTSDVTMYLREIDTREVAK